MNTGYTMYQAERGKSCTEQREIDRRAGELASAASRRWRPVARLVRLIPTLLVRDEVHSFDAQNVCHQVRG
jgi:hypothetical protein